MRTLSPERFRPPVRAGGCSVFALERGGVIARPFRGLPALSDQARAPRRRFSDVGRPTPPRGRLRKCRRPRMRVRITSLQFGRGLRYGRLAVRALVEFTPFRSSTVEGEIAVRGDSLGPHRWNRRRQHSARRSPRRPKTRRRGKPTVLKISEHEDLSGWHNSRAL